mmetsp:Transcript_11549/g.35304  ORF Transcript_11549/g.35304 Transcript_11549/m.35304 type:complete len:294 (-) Transcript_11549:137-1018(-)
MTTKRKRNRCQTVDSHDCRSRLRRRELTYCCWQGRGSIAEQGRHHMCNDHCDDDDDCSNAKQRYEACLVQGLHLHERVYKHERQEQPENVTHMDRGDELLNGYLHGGHKNAAHAEHVAVGEEHHRAPRKGAHVVSVTSMAHLVREVRIRLAAAASPVQSPQEKTRIHREQSCQTQPAQPQYPSRLFQREGQTQNPRPQHARDDHHSRLRPLALFLLRPFEKPRFLRHRMLSHLSYPRSPLRPSPVRCQPAKQISKQTNTNPTRNSSRRPQTPSVSLLLISLAAPRPSFPTLFR